MNDLFNNDTQDQLNRIEQMLIQLTAPKKKAKARDSKSEYSTAWEERVWSVYPKRAGANPKNKAYRAWEARVSNGEGFQEMIIGMTRYLHFCAATNILGTPFVMQAATFFGPECHYENAWEIPIKSAIAAMPRDDSQLEAFAVEKGLYKRGHAPQSIRNNYELRQWIQERV